MKALAHALVSVIASSLLCVGCAELRSVDESDNGQSANLRPDAGTSVSTDPIDDADGQTAGDGTALPGNGGGGAGGGGTDGPGDNNADEGRADDGITGDGTTGDDDADDGTTGDGTAGDGAADDGTTGDGDADDGTTDDGTADDGTTSDGTTSDGNADDGTTDDGSSDDGPGDSCADAPAYKPDTPYEAGDRVKNEGKLYECKPYPYTGWCSKDRYAPGTGDVWPDAWEFIADCT